MQDKNVRNNFITSSYKTSYNRKITVATRLREMFNLDNLTDGKLRTAIGAILGGLSSMYLLDVGSFWQLVLKTFYSLGMIGAGAWVTNLAKSSYNYSLPFIKEFLRKLFRRKEKPHKVKRDMD